MKKLYLISVYCLVVVEPLGVRLYGEAPKPARLTLKEAEEIALKNHPRVTAAELRAMAARQAVKQVRAAFFPSVVADATAVGAANENTRIAAGALNNPAIFDRNAEGVIVSQLITDFGRTASLTASSRAKAEAEQQNAQATREQILLVVNGAYFGALQAQDVLTVARQTVASRKTVLEQYKALATNQLKSEFDVSLVAVNVSDAELLLAKAQADLESSFANLSTALGYREQRQFELIPEPSPPPLTNDVYQLAGEALRQRPELLQLRYQREAADQFARAEKKLILPTIDAVGSAGLIPVRDPVFNDKYAAAGVNLSLPLFTGGLFAARRREAEDRAREAEQNVRDLENTVVRDVRVAQLNVNYAYQKLDLTAQLLANAQKSMDLIQVRFKVGSVSIVELTTAQLNHTAAEIANVSARYDYLLSRAALDFQIGALR